MRNKQSGLASIHLIILVVVLAVVLVTGWRLWQAHDTKSVTDINSYADCVKAGYPIQESYPTVCSANGKSFTNPDQSAAGPCVIGAGGPCNRSETPVQPY